MKRRRAIWKCSVLAGTLEAEDSTRIPARDREEAGNPAREGDEAPRTTRGRAVYEPTPEEIAAAWRRCGRGTRASGSSRAGALDRRGGNEVPAKAGIVAARGRGVSSGLLDIGDLASRNQHPILGDLYRVQHATAFRICRSPVFISVLGIIDFDRVGQIIGECPRLV